MESPVTAVRYAVRQFWSSPVFTAAAVFTLALGIGGTTAIFTHTVTIGICDVEVLMGGGAGIGVSHRR